MATRICLVCGRKRRHLPHCTLRARIESLCVREGNCLIWQGPVTNAGYGTVSTPEGSRDVHRVMYELVNGPLGRGQVVRHTCDVYRCAEPTHLLAGTQLQNIADMDARGRRLNRSNQNKGKTHCKRGHEFTPENTYWNAQGRGCKACHRLHYEKRRQATGSAA